MAFSMKVFGVANTIKFLTAKNVAIKTIAVPRGLMNGAKIMKNEVEASIAGQRAEKRSVDTGAFLHNILIRALSSDTIAILTDFNYPPYLEFGTSRIPARRHFSNSMERKRNEAIYEIQKEIRKTI